MTYTAVAERFTDVDCRCSVMTSPRDTPAAYKAGNGRMPSALGFKGNISNEDWASDTVTSHAIGISWVFKLVRTASFQTAP